MFSIQDSIREVRERIQRAASRAGRSTDEIALVAVTKGVPIARVREALAGGVSIIGESRVQEAREKRAEIAGPFEFHMVGHVQTNKAGPAVEMFDLIHSLDSERLARALDRRAEALGKRQRVLIEVNTSGDVSKFGVPPRDLDGLLDALQACGHLEVEGLMTIGPFGSGEAGARRSFRLLRSLVPKVQSSGLPGSQRGTLSMGMTDDFETAIEEGATMVRVGTAIFGSRAEPDTE
jgi:pyridoxal phosphate enzyme (YggS family)